MYNKTKHLIGLIGALCAIVLGGLLLLFEVYNIVYMVKYDRAFSNWHFLYLFFSLIVRMTLGGMLLAFGVSSLAKPTLFTSAQFGSFWLYSPRGKIVGLITLGAIKCVGGLICLLIFAMINTGVSPYLMKLIYLTELLAGPYLIETQSLTTFIQYLSIFLGAAIVVCKIIPLFLKDQPVQTLNVEDSSEEIA